MVADRMRDVTRLGEGRDREEWHPHPELVETRALRGIGAGWIRSERGTEILGILDRVVCGVEKIRGALGASAGLFTAGRIGKISALSGRNAIRRPRAGLLRLWRFGMVIKSAVLVVRDQDDGVAPVGSIAHGIDQLRYECLAALNVSGRMLVGFELGSQKTKVRVHK